VKLKQQNSSFIFGELSIDKEKMIDTENTKSFMRQ
jgi:hypothetical protein